MSSVSGHDTYLVNIGVVPICNRSMCFIRQTIINLTVAPQAANRCDGNNCYYYYVYNLIPGVLLTA